MFDRKKIKFGSLKERENKITREDLEKIWFGDVPEYENPDLDTLVDRIILARDGHRPVILMMGAHVIRRGGSRFITDLIRFGVITHIACNGACAIHDFELAYQDATCEDVEHYIKDGKFGNWRETGWHINNAVENGYNLGRGFGESIGNMIHFNFDKTKKFYSIFATAYKCNVPTTVHKGIGFDITDQHPKANYKILGGASGRDFLKFVESISELEDGVFLNIGTQVMGPEVYLKSLSMARNVATQEGREIKSFTTAVFDIVDLGDDWRKEKDPMDPKYYFRPLKTILQRTIKDGGESFYIQGDFAVTIPNLHKKILKKI